MDEDFVLPQIREDSTWEEDDEEKLEESFSDDNDEQPECSSGWVRGWESLPDVCLRHVFEFLSDRDRRSADLVCRHWHSVMHSPSLWRYRFFHFSGRLSKYRQSEYCSAVAYARSKGVYLHTLELNVYPPRRSLAARRLEQAINGLLSELIRVKAPLQSLSLAKLELDRSSWSTGLRNALVNGLLLFLRRGSSRLTSVCLNGMRNCLNHGMELLSALLLSERRNSPQCYISSLDLRGFFSGTVQVYLNPTFHHDLHQLQGLTDLSLNYSCLSNELLLALQHRQPEPLRYSGRDGITLQRFTLQCSLNEPHQQLVHGSSWTTLASNCPDLQVKLAVDQVINTNWLEKILLPEIPLIEFSMTAFYAPDEEWSVKPVLSVMLPRYRRSLQYLTLDLSNCSESVDEELLQLVQVCERLEQLRVWAFLDIRTVEKLLHIRLSQRKLLNKIRVRIYSVNDDTGDQEDQLEEILNSYLHLPPELEFFAIIYPFV